jgi:serine/threonine-protein phosphatase 4 regulatory subunit 1
VPEQAEQAEEIEDAPATPIALSVQAFTPILGTLLLSSNAMVSGPARHTVVDLLARLRTAGEAEAAGGTPDAMFGAHERRLLEDELLEQVVIGMGRLDYAYAAEHVPDSPAADPDDMDIDAAPSPIESVSEGAASAPASASTSPELSMHASARPSPPATAHSSPGAALQMQLHAQLAADPVRVALPLSAPPTPAGEWAVALSTTPAGERPPWALGLPLPPRDPWNVALPPTPAGEPGAPAPHPATPAGERPPWDVALPPTPAGGESWWAGGSPALRLTSSGIFASPDEVNPYFPMMPPVGSPVITSPSSSDSQTPVGTPIADNLTPLPAAAAGARAVAASALFSPLSDPSPSPSVPVLSPRSDSSLVSSAFPSPMTPPDPVVPAQSVYVVAKDDGPVSMEDDTTPTDDLSSAAAVASVGESVEEAPVEEPAGLDVEQAAVGRLSSMSLIAAVTASGECLSGRHRAGFNVHMTGPLRDDTKLAFAEEVERIGRDPVYWVRREAAYAVGALVRVLPLEVAQLSMVRLFGLSPAQYPLTYT